MPRSFVGGAWGVETPRQESELRATGWRTFMSRASRPKGVRAFACLRFPTPGSAPTRIISVSPAGRALGDRKMTAIDRHLFEQFADALDGELAQAGTALRVARNRSSEPGMMMLRDA